ncbi:MAG: hypothetical protein KDD62_12265, partial [Bdellovibrionales bacterium]|nr:hypothetical protein [Bdellovibrionales bacterium]
ITNRQETLRRIFNDTKPNAVITEFWPLGRTNSDVELSPFMSFIDSGPHRPIIFSLERDVLLTQKTREQVAGEDFRTDRRIVNTNRFIDEVIVRGDESVFQLQDTLPEAIGIERPIFYAGYFASPLPERTNMSEEKREVVVSAGGGYRPQDKQLYLAAIAARTHTSLDERTWRLLITPNCPENVFKEITAVANETSSKIIVERNKSSSEFKQLLSDCALSISQGGYNTTIEVATGDAPAVIVPAMDHSGREKNEQSFRAKRFEEMNLLSVVEQDQANAPYAFAQTIELAMLQQRKKQDVQVAHFRLEGAKRAAGKIVERLKEKRANV